MVIKDQLILTLYENNFPLSALSKQTILDKISTPATLAHGMFIVPGGLPTSGVGLSDVAGTARNLKLVIISSDQWQLFGDIVIFDTPNGKLLSQLQLKDLQFWVRGYITHGYHGGLSQFLHLSYTPRADVKRTKLSFQLRNK